MTTKQASDILFQTPHRNLTIPDINESTWRSYKKRYKEGKLAMEKIEDLLQRSGYRVKQEKLWEKS